MTDKPTDAIEEIISDKPTKMTKIYQRAFRMEACDPACHCCEKDLPVGATFKLATMDDCDEMLCDKCTPEDLIEKRKKAALKTYMAEPIPVYSPYLRSGGFTRVHKASCR